MRLLNILCLAFCSFMTLGASFEVVTSQKAPEEGVFDVHLRSIRQDGRHPEVQTVFEQVRAWKDLSKGHPLLSQGDQEVHDETMSMLWDWNHVLSVKLNNDTDTIDLVPTTGLSDMMLMHKNCTRCWSMHGTKWNPEFHLPAGGTDAKLKKKKLEYFYMMHLYDVEVEGFYWAVSACLATGGPNSCANDIVLYAVQSAKPWFYTLGDGFFGLAETPGYSGSEETSLISQLHSQGMLKKKIFSVHTHMFNTTSDPSQVRFGGINEALFKEGHEVLSMKTSSKQSWEVKFDSAGFRTSKIWNGHHALIEPGYPFIALPKEAFDIFKSDLLAAYPDEPVTCSDDEWCYFLTHCDKLVKSMPSLQFTFPTEHQELGFVTFKVPPESFLFNDKDYKTKLDTCHLGVVRQRFSALDHFILGSAFMENFYVVFDASDENFNRVGLSYNVRAALDEKKPASNNLISIFAITTAVALLLVFAVVVICNRNRRRQ